MFKYYYYRKIYLDSIIMEKIYLNNIIMEKYIFPIIIHLKCKMINFGFSHSYTKTPLRIIYNYI